MSEKCDEKSRLGWVCEKRHGHPGQHYATLSDGRSGVVWSKEGA